MIKIGINGFGRIGKGVLRASLNNPNVEVAAINSTNDIQIIAHLLKYDTTMGKLDVDVEVDGKDLIVNGKKVVVLADRDPANLPWGDYGVDIVAECTGKFTE